VKFLRAGVAEPIPINFTRADVRIPAVPYAIMLDGKVGYIPLQQFNETATEELETAVKRLSKEGAKGIVFDLRGNGGGYLEQAGTVANLFLKKGVEISSVRGRAGFQEVLSANYDPVAHEIPLFVVTDGRTAYASEIVAGGLQDHDRAVILGTTSFGKGIVQSVYPLEGGYDLKGLAGSLRASMRALEGMQPPDRSAAEAEAPRGRATVDAVRPHLAGKWRL
jgi:carboxyl-terminal processing protease